MRVTNDPIITPQPYSRSCGNRVHNQWNKNVACPHACDHAGLVTGQYQIRRDIAPIEPAQQMQDLIAFLAAKVFETRCENYWALLNCDTMIADVP